MAASLESFDAADGSRLPMLVFEPIEPVAGIVMFHGGALRKGSAGDLAAHCRELAARGIFAVSASYRLIGVDALRIDDCLADVRRTVAHLARLTASRGLPPSRLASWWLSTPWSTCSPTRRWN